MPTLNQTAMAARKPGKRAGRWSTNAWNASRMRPAKGSRTFLKVYGENARMAAEAYDTLAADAAARRHCSPESRSRSRNLFDVGGRRDDGRLGRVAGMRPPATRDGHRDRAGCRGGRIHSDRPHQHDRVSRFFPGSASTRITTRRATPYDRKTGRIPGGSSSGARAVSVSDGMAMAALGTDKPAAPAGYRRRCAGSSDFKPTAARRAHRRHHAVVADARLDRSARPHGRLPAR